MRSGKTAANPFVVYVLLLSVIQLSCCASYAIQAFLPLSGPDAARYQQWASAMRYSAQVASSLLSPNSLTVDVFDHSSSTQRIGELGTAAMSNASVLAVLSDATVTDTFSPFAAASSVRAPLLLQIFASISQF